MITKEDVVKQLNRLLELDRCLTEKMVDTRYLVSEAYASSEEFICNIGYPEPPCAGLIGVLNGLINDGGPPIAANYDDNMKLIGFLLLDK